MFWAAAATAVSGYFSSRDSSKKQKVASQREFEWQKELAQMEHQFQKHLIDDTRKYRANHWNNWAKARPFGEEQPEYEQYESEPFNYRGAGG